MKCLPAPQIPSVPSVTVSADEEKPMSELLVSDHLNIFAPRTTSHFHRRRTGFRKIRHLPVLVEIPPYGETALPVNCLSVEVTLTGRSVVCAMARGAMTTRSDR